MNKERQGVFIVQADYAVSVTQLILAFKEERWQ